MTATHTLVARFVQARRDPSLVVLEGFHPLKHALRFGAEVISAVVLDDIPDDALPPEVTAAGLVPQRVAADTFDRLLPARPPVPVVSLAMRPQHDPGQVVDDHDDAPVVLLERPSHPGNLGAAVRVAAAAGAAGLLAIGGADPWSPAAVRGAAGLQFALPVARADRLPSTLRPIVAFDPAGAPLGAVALPPRPVLAFGSERPGLSPDLRARASHLVRIPMRPGVSSLNLATAVAVALYALGAAPVRTSGA